MKTATCQQCSNLFIITFGSYGKFCSLSCGTTFKNKSRLEKSKIIYKLNPVKCNHCQTEIIYEKRKNKYCSASCSAKFTNSKKDYSKIKSGPPKGYKPKHVVDRPHFTKIKQCEVCAKFHPKPGKTCSAKCKNKLISISVNRRIDEGWNPQENRCRSTPSYLEKSFNNWLIANNILEFIQNKTFRCGKKIYYGDFFFPDKKLLIELDGIQHKETVEYDLNRDQSILRYHDVTTIRITHKEYMAKTKMELLLQLFK
jgi:hypothetical protein